MIAVLLTLALPPPSAQARDEKFFHSIVDGFRFVRRERGLRVNAAAMCLNTFLAAPFIALVPAMAVNVLHNGTAGTSVLVTAQGIGAVGWRCSLGSLVERYGPRRLLVSLMAAPAARARGVRVRARPRAVVRRALRRRRALPRRALDVLDDRAAACAREHPRPRGLGEHDDPRLALPARRGPAGQDRRRHRPARAPPSAPRVIMAAVVLIAAACSGPASPTRDTSIASRWIRVAGHGSRRARTARAHRARHAEPARSAQRDQSRGQPDDGDAARRDRGRPRAARGRAHRSRARCSRPAPTSRSSRRERRTTSRAARAGSRAREPRLPEADHRGRERPGARGRFRDRAVVRPRRRGRERALRHPRGEARAHGRRGRARSGSPSVCPSRSRSSSR